MTDSQGKPRCPWPGNDPLYCDYHDLEWGKPVHDDRLLFEFLVLEGAQAGLSWITILRKREAYRQAFAGFNPGQVARFGDQEKATLLANPGIVRNRLKIESAVSNAQSFLDLCEKAGSFDAWLWKFVDGVPVINHWREMQDVPCSTPLSDTISKELKKSGFNFVGSTIIYSFMQAVGLVNDHLTCCFRWHELKGA